MLVLLKQNWFGPGGVYYAVNKGGTNIPNELCGQDKDGKWLHLPSKTTKMRAAPELEKAPDPSLKDLDLARAEGDAISAAAAGAQPEAAPMTKEQKRLAKAANLRKEIEAEQAAAE